MNNNRKNDLIYGINSHFFSRTFSLRKLIRASKSNGPNEVWKSISRCKSRNKIRIVKFHKRTWPSPYSNVIIIKDFIYKIPPELINKI